MAMMSFASNQNKDASFELKVPLFKRFTAYLTRRKQDIRHDRQQLWHSYRASIYAQGMPKCIWRRHGALLMYARSEKAGVNNNMPQKRY